MWQLCLLFSIEIINLALLYVVFQHKERHCNDIFVYIAWFIWLVKNLYKPNDIEKSYLNAFFYASHTYVTFPHKKPCIWFWCMLPSIGHIIWFLCMLYSIQESYNWLVCMLFSIERSNTWLLSTMFSIGRSCTRLLWMFFSHRKIIYLTFVYVVFHRKVIYLTSVYNVFSQGSCIFDLYVDITSQCVTFVCLCSSIEKAYAWPCVSCFLYTIVYVTFCVYILEKIF